MKKDTKVLIILVAIVVVAIVAINYVKTEEGYDNPTMQCIADNSMLIASKTCGHCVNQVKILGNDGDIFNIVYIDEDPSVLDRYDIRGVPAWVINEEIYEGVHSMEELKQLTGC